MAKKLVVLLKGENEPMVFEDVDVMDSNEYRLRVNRQGEGRIAEFDKDTVQRWHLVDSN